MKYIISVSIYVNNSGEHMLGYIHQIKYTLIEKVLRGEEQCVNRYGEIDVSKMISVKNKGFARVYDSKEKTAKDLDMLNSLFKGYIFKPKQINEDMAKQIRTNKKINEKIKR